MITLMDLVKAAAVDAYIDRHYQEFTPGRLEPCVFMYEWIAARTTSDFSLICFGKSSGLL